MSYRLPLKVRKSGESYQIVDALDRAIYIYTEDSPLRREIMHRWTSQEAEDIAKLIARFLTERATAEAAPSPPACPARSSTGHEASGS